MIINRIEISYFRSIYSCNIGGLKNLNIIVGKNDSGKSNILKALNLFFNNEIDASDGFKFHRDLTKGREEEARRAKGRAQVWIKIHFNNKFEWRSLPDSFWVKRSWNRYSDVPEQTHVRGISETTLSKFFKKIKYRYVPAVRDEQVFEYYIAALFDVLQELGAEEVLKRSKPLIDEINKRTSYLSDELHSLLGFQSKINLPTDLHHLFATLDFSTIDGVTGVSFRQRGDGVQTRHIPSILHFISAKSSRTHIWGFEEPENSLEMSVANDLATTFKDVFSETAQIFTTTHSPSFYSLTGGTVTKWGVIKGYDDNGHVRSTVERIEELEYWDNHLGLLPEVARLMQPKLEELRQAKETVETIQSKMQSIQKPLLITEGKTDVQHIRKAKEKLNITDLDVEFFEVSCDWGDSKLKLLLEQLAQIAQPRKIIGVFDRDVASIVNDIEANGSEYKSYGNNVYAFCIPVPEGREQYTNISIEFFYSDGNLKKEHNGKRLYFDNEVEFRQSAANKRLRTLVKLGAAIPEGENTKKVFDENVGDTDWAHSKAKFASLVETDDEFIEDFDFSCFEVIFERIRQIVSLG